MAEKKNDLAEKLEPVGDAVKKASRKVTTMAREAAKMAEPSVKAAVKKAEPTVKKAEKALRDTGKKAAAALTPEVFVQWNGGEAACADVVERARQDFKSRSKSAIRSCKIYIKPEDGMAYYVINGQEGKVPL